MNQVARPLEEISTRWSDINDPEKFVLRYATAIRTYLLAILRDPVHADEVSQRFLLRAMERGFDNASPDKGCFRRYLKTAVRNAALMFLRHETVEQKRRHPLETLQLNVVEEDALERQWCRSWRSCVLARAMAVMQEESERQGTELHYVLQLIQAFPLEDSQARANRLAKLTGKVVRADAFRQQASRARRKLAEQVMIEVATTLELVEKAAILEELGDLELTFYVMPYLQPDWYERYCERIRKTNPG